MKNWPIFTFNHGVLGSSPSRLTKEINELATKAVLEDGSDKQRVSRKPASAFCILPAMPGPSRPGNAWAARRRQSGGRRVHVGFI